MFLSDQQKARAAADMVDAQIGFYIHLAVYVVVIGILAVVDWRTADGWWVQWPAMGWGLGILGHALGVFGRMPRFVQRWRVRRIDRVRQGL
jgi:hypothetical protein